MVRRRDRKATAPRIVGRAIIGVLAGAVADEANKKVRVEMAALRERWERSNDLHALIGALFFCFSGTRPLPAWVFAGLRDNLIAQLPKPSTNREIRHHYARAFMESGTGWNDSFAATSKLLTGTPAWAGVDQIEKDYKLVERSLPLGHRRRRTYRPNPPLR